MAGHHIMIVLIVAIGVFGGVLRARYKAASAQRQHMPDPETERMREEVKAMRDRIAVLERIVTDRGNLLEHEIEQLRDR
jgi:hypothetical protein